MTFFEVNYSQTGQCLPITFPTVIGPSLGQSRPKRDHTKHRNAQISSANTTENIPGVFYTSPASPPSTHPERRKWLQARLSGASSDPPTWLPGLRRTHRGHLDRMILSNALTFRSTALHPDSNIVKSSNPSNPDTRRTQILQSRSSQRSCRYLPLSFTTLTFAGR